MANDVFANGREISCKAGDGKSICAFPDVCFTPPENPATPPGVPVPYPNTGLASDSSEGSRDVQISGKEIMLKNKSYFKSSVGDEAGCATKKGAITSTNKGKVYFISWSFDVKIEGENAVRHLDLTTHNHASPMSNDPSGMHQDTAATSGPPDPGKCNHEYECKPVTHPGSKGKSVQEMIDSKKAGPQAGDPFEGRALEHNRSQLKGGEEVSPLFPCKKCSNCPEIDHVTTDENGNITKIVQCKSDQSKLDPSKKGVIIKPKQLVESRKLANAISKCQESSGVECKVEYKLESTSAGEEAKRFLEKKDPPLVTMVL